MRSLWDLPQFVYLRMEGFYLRWRLRRRGIDADSLPEIQELRRRYEAGEPLQPDEPDQPL
jgi:hypothetical protein